MTDYAQHNRGRPPNGPNVFFLIVMTFIIFAILMIGVAE